MRSEGEAKGRARAEAHAKAKAKAHAKVKAKAGEKTKTGGAKPIVRLAISLGCPCGIGPEVAVRGALDIAGFDGRIHPLLVGDLEAARAGARAMGIDERRVVQVRTPEDAWGDARRGAIFVHQIGEPLAAADRRPGKPTARSGAAQLAWIDAATDLVTSGQADALVTGPVSKDVIARSGARGAARFRGHTEHLQERLGASSVTMAFWSEGLVSSLVTTHLPLSKVPAAITRDEVARAIAHTAWLTNLLHDESRRNCIAVASLNPHAGEHGLLGDEEAREIAPGVALGKERMKKLRLKGGVEGPIGAETAFRRMSLGWFSAVVAMYHDQATIPMKLRSFGEAVNVTLGLPIVRTSVDHGTAYDAAGKGDVDWRGMVSAMKLAALLHRRWKR